MLCDLSVTLQHQAYAATGPCTGLEKLRARQQLDFLRESHGHHACMRDTQCMTGT